MKNTVYSKQNMSIVFGIILIFMITGSFFDFQISSAVFNESSIFGMIFASYGQLPVSAGMMVGGTLLIYSADRKRKISMIISFIFGGLSTVFGLFMGCFEPTMYLGKVIPKFILIIISAGIMIAVEILAIRLVRNASRTEVRKLACYILFAVFMTTIVINIIKIPWGRPRMRMIAATPEASFQPWWVIGSSMKETLMAAGIAAEEFKSFPSGHTASAACMLIITAFPKVNQKLKGKEQRLFWMAVAFAFMVGFSRIIMGAHFLTDITVGFTVGLIINMIGYRWFLDKQ